MSPTRPLPVAQSETPNARWARRRDIPLAMLAWIALIAVILWGAAHISRTLFVLVIAALLAYALAPGVQLLRRVLPRPLAILLMYLVVFVGLGVLLYYMIDTTVRQAVSLSQALSYWLLPNGRQPGPIEQLLRSFGISQNQINQARDQLIAGTEELARSIVPFVTGIFDFLLNIVLIAIISIYFLIDGPRVARWARSNMPRQVPVNFLLDTFQRVVGGYIRGQILLSLLIGVLVGGGMALFRVPYALLLGVLAFVLEFIPILGTLISGVICTLIALTQGWPIALGVLLYFIVVHVLEGDIIGPHIVGKAVGLHPIVSIVAVIAGTELFGIVGALLASPIAGILQALLIALWVDWRRTHREQFATTPAATDEARDESQPLHSQQNHAS